MSFVFQDKRGSLSVQRNSAIRVTYPHPGCRKNCTERYVQIHMRTRIKVRASIRGELSVFDISPKARRSVHNRCP